MDTVYERKMKKMNLLISLKLEMITWSQFLELWRMI